MIAVAVASIALTAATQAWSTVWRRDSEEELIFRGTQYSNAILAYQKEHGGQYPLRLEDLFKPGPRRLRYIRKLFKDPIAKDGKWGLIYLAPGGQGIYDPRAAQKAQAQSAKDGWDTGAASQSATTGANPAGSMPFNGALNGAGLPAGAGAMSGVLPPGVAPPQPGSSPGGGSSGEELVSEPPLGWPIVGVVSRASGKRSDDTYKIYKGHEKVDEWQFLAWDLNNQQSPIPGNPAMFQSPFQGLGPGFGGRGAFGGIGGGPGGPMPGLGGGGPGGQGGRQFGGGPGGPGGPGGGPGGSPPGWPYGFPPGGQQRNPNSQGQQGNP